MTPDPSNEGAWIFEATEAFDEELAAWAKRHIYDDKVIVTDRYRKLSTEYITISPPIKTQYREITLPENLADKYIFQCALLAAIEVYKEKCL